MNCFQFFFFGHSENIEELKANLTSLGANYVVTEEEFQNANKMKEILKVAGFHILV